MGVSRAVLKSRLQQPTVKTIPAPVGGWNARDSLDQMPETDASLLDNWFPGLGRVELRKGFIKHQQYVGLAPLAQRADIETLAEYHAGTVRKMIASGGVINQPASENLFTYSEQFDNAAWTKAAASITADAIAAPDGTMTADKLVEDTSTGSHTLHQDFSVGSGIQYTASWRLKAGEHNWIRLQFEGTPVGGARFVFFDLSAGVVGTVGSGGSTPDSYSIEADNEGFYVCSITATTSAVGTINIRLYMAEINGQVTPYTGDGTSGLYVWGADLEKQSGPTAYIKTVASAVSRAAGNFYELWDVTGSPVRLAEGFASNRWQHANFNGNMGLVNGSDAPQVFDGSAMSAMTVSGTALTVSNLIGINVFKSRTYFWEANSQDFWYSATNALGGTLTKFPLSRVGQFGGNLVAMGTWTRDGGNGVDDLAVFFMSSGEVIIYQGSDPGTAADWALVGVFRIGAPVNIRAFAKFGSDMVVATKDGYQALSRVLPQGRSASAVSDKIRGAVLQQAAATGSGFGWQIMLYPRGNMALFNYPTATAGKFEQHVVNLTTGAWCRFKGIDARCFALFNDMLYFGGANGVVYLADTGLSDDGANIEMDARQAPTYLGSRSRLKQVTMLRPVLASDGDLPLAVALDADFADNVRPYTTSTFTGAGAEWDEAVWDVAEWGGVIQSKPRWLVATGTGYSFSLRLRVRTKAQNVYWYSTSYAFKPGGVL